MSKILSNLLLLVFSIFFSLILIEGLLIVFFPEIELIQKKVVWDHWTSKNMAQWYNDRYEYDERIGFEKKNVFKEIKKIANLTDLDLKILILGDSLTEWGNYVNLFKLNVSKEYSNKKISIINAGVMGYDTYMEYQYLNERGIQLNPDIVVLQFCQNDFFDTPIIVKQTNESWLAYHHTGSEIKNFNFLTRTRLYKLLSFNFQKLNIKSKKNVKDPLIKINNLLNKKNISFYILVFPILEDSIYSDIQHMKILKILDELNLSSQIIDLKPYFANYSYTDIRKDKYHQNHYGDKIVAKAMMDKLIPLIQEKLYNSK